MMSLKILIWAYTPDRIWYKLPYSIQNALTPKEIKKQWAEDFLSDYNSEMAWEYQRGI